jgi:hypothetical protein
VACRDVDDESAEERSARIGRIVDGMLTMLRDDGDEGSEVVQKVMQDFILHWPTFPEWPASKARTFAIAPCTFVLPACTRHDKLQLCVSVGYMLVLAVPSEALGCMRMTQSRTCSWR